MLFLRMPFLELFSSSFLLTIGIVIILIGVVFAYVNYRMSDQDHKISSMVSLVSTMAEELQFFRTKMNTLQTNVTTNVPFQQQQNNIIRHSGAGLIEVSDDDDDDDDEYEHQESDDDVNDDVNDNDNENDYNSSNHDDDDEDEDEDEDEDDHDEDEEGDSERDPQIKSIHLDETDLQPFDEPLSDDVIDLSTLPIPHIDDEKAVHEEGVNDNPELKTISITEEIDESMNYKKMSLAKLRHIVVEKGIVSDPSKMKKHELLKMLEEEEE